MAAIYLNTPQIHSPSPFFLSLSLSCTNQTLNSCGLLFTLHTVSHEMHTSHTGYRAAWKLTREKKTRLTVEKLTCIHYIKKWECVCTVCELVHVYIYCECLCVPGGGYQTVRVWFSFIRDVFCGTRHIQGGGLCVYMRRGASETACLSLTCQEQE